MGTPNRLAGPLFLSGSASNIVIPIANIYMLVKLIHLCNTDTVNHSVTVYIGTASGTNGQQVCSALSVPANSIYQIPMYAELSYNNSDNVVALADTASKVTITVMGDQSVYPA